MQVNISVVIPCYNQAKYLDECLQSVIIQDYEYWECIIVNDGSNDNTEQIAKQWQNKDSRFKYVFKDNGGLSSARNKGIEKAIGKFILPLDADDKIGKKYLKLAIAEFKKKPNLKVVYCKAKKFDKENGQLSLKPFSLQDLAKENMIFCSGLYRKQDWEKVGGYDLNMIHGLEDWEFWISMLKNGGEVSCLDEVLFYYRIKEESMLKSLDDVKYKASCEYINIKHADFYVKEFGSFIYVQSQLNAIKQSLNLKLKSKKFVLNTFFKVFFGFSIFKTFGD